MPHESQLPVALAPENTTKPEPEDVWEHVAAMDEFKLLLIAKSEFVIPAVITFVVYYFLLPISVGYFPQLMDKRVGPVNLAYLFALSQFFVAWTIAALYVRGARKFDNFGTRIMDHLDKREAERLKGGN
ncbi:MAG TPA: DUF485 domain-containing protein [Terriglobales bacterium]|jgi:uncharacterized membrane protein (DUF485 family)|nr:DUF485 domain-containing protein [Terriglobales bacterium]